MARVNGITQFLPATHTTILTLLPDSVSIHQMAPPERGSKRLIYSLLLNFSTSEVWKAELA